MTSWHAYLALQSFIAVLIFLLPSEWLRGRRMHLLRICLAAGTLSFFIDAPFEAIRVWSWGDGIHLLVGIVPIENLVLIAGSVPFAVLLYSTIGRLRRSGRAARREA